MAIEERLTTNGIKFRAVIYQRGMRIGRATFNAKKEAEEWEAEQNAKLDREKYFPFTPKRIKFKELFELWLRIHAEKNKDANSVIKDKQSYRSYISHFFAQRYVTEISPGDLDLFIDYMQNHTELSNNTINKNLEIIRTVLNFGMKRRYLLYNPIVAIKFLPVYEQKFDYWNFQEASEFLSQANCKYMFNRRWVYVSYLLALTTGMRLGEITVLEWENILFDSNIIRVCATFDRATNRVKYVTKGKKIRYVPLNKDLKVELIHLKQNSSSKFTFSTKTANCICKDNLRKRFFYRDAEEFGIRMISWHSLRHTYASHYMMNGGNIYDLQLILGHSDLKLTKRYAHLSPESIASKANVVSFNLNLLQNASNVVHF